jgi:hypothetical protein
MLVEGLDPAAILLGAECPRCHAVGLVPISGAELRAAPARDQHASTCSVEPSVAARCPACGLVGEWPAMSMGTRD